MSIMSLIIGTKFDDGDQDHHYSTSIVHYTLAYIDILCGPPLGGRVTRYTPSVRPSVCLSVPTCLCRLLNVPTNHYCADVLFVVNGTDLEGCISCRCFRGFRRHPSVCLFVCSFVACEIC